MGPTASGKTEVALALAQHFPIDIISVDSVMVYKGMDIGTAKPTPAELQQAPHHLIDIRFPFEAYSAADFVADARYWIEQAFAAQRIPFLVGGTMLYFRALCFGLSSLPSSDPVLRARLSAQLEAEGLASLYAQLQQVDPVASGQIKPMDTQRILRALEVYQLTGQPLSSLWGAVVPVNDWEYVPIRLIPSNRAWLHQRITQRFAQMLAQGFLEEVRHLQQDPRLTEDLPAMRAVGYRQAIAYLKGETSSLSWPETGIAATRQLAKRQITWLRHWPEGVILDPCQGPVLEDILRTVII